jgi:hypothetical protein
VGIYIMVQRKKRSLEDSLGAIQLKLPKQKEVSRKTTKEHLSDFAGKPGQKIGGRGFLGG